MTEWTRIFRDANARLSPARWANGKTVWSADVGDRQLEVVDITVTANAVAPEHIYLGLKTREVLIRDRVYVVDGRRVQWARSYLPAEVTAGTRLEDVDTGPGGTLARLSELGCEPTLFVEDMEVGFPDERERTKLAIGEAEPVCRIDRIALAGDDAVEFTVMTLVGAAYKFRSTIPA